MLPVLNQHFLPSLAFGQTRSSHFNFNFIHINGIRTRWLSFGMRINLSYPRGLCSQVGTGTGTTTTVRIIHSANSGRLIQEFLSLRS